MNRIPEPPAKTGYVYLLMIRKEGPGQTVVHRIECPLRHRYYISIDKDGYAGTLIDPESAMVAIAYEESIERGIPFPIIFGSS